MSENPFFTIIMPVYNVQNYIKKAVDSVLHQTFGDFELVLIDDYSTDSSRKICDEYAAKDKRVRVIHLPVNAGVSHARNQGMQEASGTYVIFMDSDDYIQETLYEKIFEKITEKPQVVVWGLQEEYQSEDGTVFLRKEVTSHEISLFNQQTLRQYIIYLEKNTLLGYVWNKAYKRSFLQNGKFAFDENVKINEDFLFNLQVFEKLASLIFLPETAYFYQKYVSGSATTQFIKDYYEIHTFRVQAVYDLYQGWGMLTDDICQILASIYVRYILSALQRNCEITAHMNHKQRKQWLKNLYQTTFFQELKQHISSSNLYLRIVGGCLKKENITVILSIARIIHFVKAKFPVLFSRLKQNR